MFHRLKEKFRRRHSKKESKSNPANQEKPNNGAAPPTVANPPTATTTPPKAPSEKPVEEPAVGAPAGEKPKQPDGPKDLWLEALNSLPASKQETLKKMGFNQSTAKSVSVESSIDDLVGVVQSKQEECEKKFWKVKVGDEEIVLRNYTDKIVDWLGKAGDIAVQFAPPQAAIPWAVIKSAMQIPVIEGEQMAALLATTEKIVRVISRGQVYESVYLKNTPASPTDNLSKNLQSALTTIYTTSLDLLADSGNLFSKNTASRTIQALLNPGKVSGGLSAISEQEDDLMRDVSACEVRRSANADDSMIEMLNALNAPMKRMDEGIQHLLQNMDQTDRIKMLEWISPVPFGKNHNNIKERRAPGTGEWIFQHEDFKSWEQGNSSIFWLQGSPGTGKTYLTSTVVDRIQNRLDDTPKDEGFAFFYCDKNEQRRSEPLSILQSIVRQLSTTAKNPESTQIKLRELYNECREGGSTFSLQQCKEQIQASLNIYEKTTIVIDAMDECDSDTRDELIDALSSFVSNTSERPVQVFISSRPDPMMENLLDGTPNIGINANDNKGDIEKFLSIEMDKLARKAPFFKRLKDAVVKALLERCQGMFQWAALQIHQIQKCKLEKGVWAQLENLPSDLQKAYDQAWDQVEELGEPERLLTSRAMQWVMAANHPLTSAQIICAVRINSDGEDSILADEIDEQGLLSLCNNLLTIDTQQKVWRFAHLSVREYLEGKMEWTVPRVNLHAASACLSWFNDVYAKDDFDIEWEGKPEPEDIYHIMHQFQVYMRHYWQRHVQDAEDEDDKLATLLKAFLGSPTESSKQYRKWYELIAGDLSGIIDVSEDSNIMDPNSDYHVYRVAAGLNEDWEDETDFNQAQHPEYDEFETELEPVDAAILAMCHFSFDKVLSDWWKNEEYDVSLVNQRGHSLLALAARAGCTNICKTLVEKGADVNRELQGLGYKAYGSALIAAAHRGHTETVKYLVENGADVDMKVGEGDYSNALVAALSSQKIDTVKYLIQEAKADVNISHSLEDEEFDEDDETITLLTPVGLAAKMKGVELLKILVNSGADINIKEQSGNPLSVALRSGRLEAVKYLIQEAKADVNVQLSEASFCTVLERAVYDNRNFEIVKWLVEAGAEVNPPEAGQFGPPLSSAAYGLDKEEGSNIEIVRYLVEAGADIHKGSDEKSPVALALESEDMLVMRFLVEKGAVIDLAESLETAVNQFNTESFLYLAKEAPGGDKLMSNQPDGHLLVKAADTADSPKWVKLLVEAGANVNLVWEDGDYCSPLATAAGQSIFPKVETVKYLIEKGADVNMPLKSGYYGSALVAAAKNDNSEEMVQCLIDAGADVNMQLSHGEYGNALTAAAFQRYNIETVRCLLKAGADVNILPQHGDYGSPLAAAATDDQKAETLKLLIEAGADANATLIAGEYENALAAAVVAGRCVELAKILVDAGADVNVPLKRGKYGSLLAGAANQCDDEMVQFLLDAGVDVNAAIEHGDYRSAMAAAKEEEDNDAVIEILRKHGAKE